MARHNKKLQKIVPEIANPNVCQKYAISVKGSKSKAQSGKRQNAVPSLSLVECIIREALATD